VYRPGARLLPSPRVDAATSLRSRSHSRLRFLVIAAIALALPAAAGLSASVPPPALLASILQAAQTERSFHAVNVAHWADVRVRQVNDDGTSEGIQRITFQKGASSGQVTVIVSAGNAYVRGDLFALVNYMGFNAAAAATYAGQWILIPTTDRDYATVALDVTLPSAIKQLKLASPLSRVPDTKIDGRPVVGVHGSSTSLGNGGTATATLYARAAGPPLPVRETVSQGSMRGAVTFSNWNKPIHVTRPTTSVPIAATGLE
jgi:hypothetical protein